ncbi:MAG: BCCT family transporter [Cyanobacteria bacterium J06641_5]
MSNRILKEIPTYNRTHVPGTNNIRVLGLDIHPTIAPISSAIALLVVAFTLAFTDRAELLFGQIKDAIAASTGWFYILSASLYLIFVVYIAFSKLGRIRIGGQDAQAEFSLFSWFAMLVSAGMGIGLMFWSVAEPMRHFFAPPQGLSAAVGGTPEAAKLAMAITFFHWGLHPWGIYALVGLALAFCYFNRGRPLAISSIFYPILGERIYGWPGQIVDILAVLATLSGLATSLGTGAEQIDSGLQFLFGVPDTELVQVAIVAVVTAITALSVSSGLQKGVKQLSEINLYLSGVLLAFILLTGPAQFVLNTFVEELGYYTSLLPTLSFWTEAFSKSNWQADWTLFYWSWWIAWSPFVGTFIARVSKGRTVREFIIGVLLVPSLLTFLWMSVFGGTALDFSLAGDTSIAAAVNADVSTALFALLARLPMPPISSLLAIALVVTFFVTSANSGALVTCYLTAGGKLEPSVALRLFWVILEGLVAVALLLGGGLSALQAASLTVGLPFALVLLVMCYSLYRGLQDDGKLLDAATDPRLHDLPIRERVRRVFQASPRGD